MANRVLKSWSQRGKTLVGPSPFIDGVQTKVYFDPITGLAEVPQAVYDMFLEVYRSEVEDGENAGGDVGKSAYELAVDEGFTGTLSEWLASLVGPQGEQGTQGPPGDSIQGDPGAPGDSAYQIAVDEGFIGTVEEWLLSLVGAAGTDGEDGEDGGMSAAELIDFFYPVGSIITLNIATNPGTLFGHGTWAAYGAGRTLVAIDAGQSEFNVVDEEGGVKEVTLTAAQSGLPQHTHTQNSHNHTQDAHGHTMSGGSSDDTSAPFTGPDASTSTATAFGGGIGQTTATNQAATAVNQNAGPTDASAAHTNLQPYKVVHRWIRTA